MTDEERFQQGLANRREVLSPEYVEAALAGADEFSMPLQDFITRVAWGDIWNRSGLDRRTRSLLVLAMTTALNRPHELRIHLKGALRNGVTREEIRELMLQAAVYCGAPAAMDGFRIAREVFAEMDKARTA